jgi:hypothetical protein
MERLPQHEFRDAAEKDTVSGDRPVAESSRNSASRVGISIG